MLSEAPSCMMTGTVSGARGPLFRGTGGAILRRLGGGHRFTVRLLGIEAVALGGDVLTAGGLPSAVEESGRSVPELEFVPGPLGGAERKGPCVGITVS